MKSPPKGRKQHKGKFNKAQAKKNKPYQVHGFSLRFFEVELRRILGVFSNRTPGCPGSDFPDTSLPPSIFAKQYLIDSLMSKFDDGASGSSKEVKAMQAFEAAEEGCFWSNLFFSQEHTWISKRYPDLEEARRHILWLLGEEPCLERISRRFGWGPGATTRLPRKEGDSCYKYSGHPECTPNAYIPSVCAVLAHNWWTPPAGFFPEGPRTVWGSRLDMVPKNYKTHRTIAIEPDLNMYLQKGIGSEIREKLRRVGIDLDDQSKNREGSKDMSLATIDFSMASDSVSQGLVAYLLPPAWVSLIGDFRSECIVYPDGTIHRLNKISSMGNGFTFELETLIFWALAKAAAERFNGKDVRVLVYGDDVLLPVGAAPGFIALARTAGFTTNSSKSFIAGPFRESCGMHVHTGCDVTPFYVRRPVTDLPELFLLHNNLSRWRTRVRPLLTRWEYDDLGRLLGKLRSFARSGWRKPRIPDGYGDGAFIGSFAAVEPRTHPDGWECFVAHVLVQRTIEVEESLHSCPGLLTKAGMRIGQRAPFRKYYLRGNGVRWLTTLVPSNPGDSGVLPSRDGWVASQSIAIPWAAFG